MSYPLLQLIHLSGVRNRPLVLAVYVCDDSYMLSLGSGIVGSCGLVGGGVTLCVCVCFNTLVLAA